MEDRLNSMYNTYLGRDIDNDALINYKNNLEGCHITWDQIETSILSSAERSQVVQKNKLLNNLIDLAKTSPHIYEQPFNFCKNINIKFYGPIGRTGYSQSAKAYAETLFTAKANVQFVVTYVHDVPEKPCKRDILLYTLLGNTVLNPDFIIIQAVPNQWEYIVKQERKHNPQAVILVITLWESSRIHESWIPRLDEVDGIICCSEWNANVFAKSTSTPVYTIHSPITIPVMAFPVKDPFDLKWSNIPADVYMFYTINEWTCRKGIEDLIDCFLDAFIDVDSVCLVIKSAVIPQKLGDSYIQEQSMKHRKPAKIILDCSDYSDDQILALHKRGNCYISLSKAEGIGLGACEATLHGKPVIITAYGGQLDYLKNVWFVGFTETPVHMCSAIYLNHDDCHNFCIHYPWYVYDSQYWGNANLADCVRTMKYVAKHKPDAIIAKKYIQKNFNIATISSKFGALFSRLSTDRQKTTLCANTFKCFML